MRRKAFIRLTLRKIRRFKRFVWINLRLIKRRQKQNWRYKRKRLIIKYSIITVLALLGFFAIRNKMMIVDKSTHTKEVIFADTNNTLEQYLFQLRWIESADNHKARRHTYAVIRTSHGLDTVRAYSQYIGFYQMGTGARKCATEICPSLSSISSDEFWNSAFYQHKASICWFIWLRNYMSPEIAKFDKKFYGTYYITESGIMGMSHLVGPNAVKNLLNSGDYSLYNTYRYKDGNKKNGVDYLQQLGRYNLRLDRFFDERGVLNEEDLDKFVTNIINNKTVRDNIIEEIIEEKYYIVDSVDYVKDSVNFPIF
jgi:hypothetical protein